MCVQLDYWDPTFWSHLPVSSHYVDKLVLKHGCVYACVCMACMFVCFHAYVCLYACVCLHECVCACAFVHFHACLCVYSVCVCVCVWQVSIRCSWDRIASKVKNCHLIFSQTSVCLSLLICPHSFLHVAASAELTENEVIIVQFCTNIKAYHLQLEIFLVENF